MRLSQKIKIHFSIQYSIVIKNINSGAKLSEFENLALLLTSYLTY